MPRAQSFCELTRGQGLQDGCDLGVIARGFAQVPEDQGAAGKNDQDPAQLPRVTAGHALPEAALHGPGHVLPGGERAKRLGQASLHLQGPIRLELRVHVEGAGDLKLFLEGLRELPVAVAHEVKLAAAVVDSRKLAVHLHRLLAAEESAEVAEEDEHRRPLAPELLERVLAPVEVANHRAGRGV